MVSLLLAGSLAFLSTVSFTNDDPKADVKDLQKTLEKALLAYNKDDYKEFYKDFAKIVESLSTEQAYDTLYKGMYKKQFGDYLPKSMKFVQEGSVTVGEILVVYFDAEFSKEKKVRVSVNFQYEDKVYKLMQVGLAKGE